MGAKHDVPRVKDVLLSRKWERVRTCGVHYHAAHLKHGRSLCLLNTTKCNSVNTILVKSVRTPIH